MAICYSRQAIRGKRGITNNTEMDAGKLTFFDILLVFLFLLFSPKQ